MESVDRGQRVHFYCLHVCHHCYKTFISDIHNCVQTSIRTRRIRMTHSSWSMGNVLEINRTINGRTGRRTPHLTFSERTNERTGSSGCSENSSHIVCLFRFLGCRSVEQFTLFIIRYYYDIYSRSII